MTVSLKHAFTSNVADSGDTTLVQPSNWNAEHTLTAAANTLLGAVTAGAVTEITCTAAGRTLIAGATAAAQATSLGLGTTDSPTFGGSITLNSSSSFLPQMILNNTAADSSGPYWFTKKLRGSSPANSGDSLGTFIFQSNGNDGLTYNSAFLTSISEGAGATWHAAGFGFNTINTSGTTARRMRIRASGCVAIGSDGADSVNLYLTKTITGSTSSYVSLAEATVQSDVTSLGVGFSTIIGTAAASFTLGGLHHFRATQTTIGAGSAVTAQYGFMTTATLVGATTNYSFFAGDGSSITASKTYYGFYSNVNTASGGGTAYAFYAAGTAPNIFSGNVGIGSTSVTNVNLRLSRSITGSTTSYAGYFNGTVQSDVTANASGMYVSISTAASAFTLANLNYYFAVQGTVGAGSSITNQYGFRANSDIIEGTTNYSFHAGNTAAVAATKTSYGFYSAINIATGGGTTYGFYAGGTALNYFAGQTIVNNTFWNYAPAPTSKSTTATLTAAELKTSIINTTGTSYTVTLPLGTDIETGFTPFAAVDVGFDFYIVNTASGTITLAVNTGITSLGTLTIATGVSAHFRLRRTAANTYVVYRLS